MYQIRDDLALSVYGRTGDDETFSPIIDATVTGLFVEVGFESLYALNESWDIAVSVGVAKYQYDSDGFEIMRQKAGVELAYIW